MSQLADLEDVVKNHTTDEVQAGVLFYEILGALNWEIDGVNSPEDAQVYLFDRG